MWIFILHLKVHLFLCLIEIYKYIYLHYARLFSILLNSKIVELSKWS